MKFLVALSVLAACVAAEGTHEESVRDKRGILSAPIPISYSSHYVHHTPAVAVAYHAPITKYVAPIPAVKVVQPLPVTKVVAPAISYTSLYPSYGYAHGFGHGIGFGHGFGHGYAHGFGHFH